MLVTAGRPCGPNCLCRRKVMHVKKGALFISLFEIFFACVVMGACTGTLVALQLNDNDLKDTKEYNKDDVYWLSFACIWQSCCHAVFLFLGGILLIAHIRRSMLCCAVWMAGAIIVEIVSLVGTGFTFTTLYVFDAMVALVFLRAYFFWVVLTYYLDIKANPDEFPFSPPPVIVVKKPEPEPVPTESQLHYIGDG